MRKRILALSLSLLFLGGMTMTGYSQVNNSITKTEVNDDDDKKKKSSKKSTKDCSTKKSCCKSDLDAKCKDKDASKEKKGEGKQK